MNRNDDQKTQHDIALSEDELILLSAEPVAMKNLDVNSPRMQSLRSRVMAQVDEPSLANDSALITVRADAGDWQQINDKIKRKMLHVDKQRGIESFLLRIEPGAEDAPHQHSSDEHCLVLEGSVSFGDVHLFAGDYHLAPKDSWHEKAYSEHGALLYIQTGVGQSISL